MLEDVPPVVLGKLRAGYQRAAGYQPNVTYIGGFCGADTRVCRLDNRVETRVLVCTGPTGISQPLEAFKKRAETILGAADTSVRATSEHDPRAPVAVNVSDIGLPACPTSDSIAATSMFRTLSELAIEKARAG